MKKKVLNIAALMVAAIFVLSCCGEGDYTGKKGASHPFPKVYPPAMLGDSPAAAIYVAERFWNPFIDSSAVFSKDTSLIGGVSRDDFARAFSEYASILSYIPIADGLKAQSNFISRLIALQRNDSTNTVFRPALELTERVFYGVNSELRNEELYLPIASAMAECTLADEATRGRYAFEAANCSKNRIGAVAADFNYTTSEGVRSSLHKTPGENTIIFFSNPGCTACKEIIEVLGQSLTIQKLLDEGKLTIINLYIDEDLAEWHNHMGFYPKEWISCYNHDMEIREGGIYDIRAIPTLYLLDREKRVLLKDCTIQPLLHHLAAK